MLRALVKDSAVYAVGVIASQLVGFLMIPIYTRVLTPADYGIIETIMRVVDVINLFLALGLVEALLRHYYLAKDEDDRRRLVASTFSFNLLVVVGGCLLILPLSPQLARLAFGHDRYAQYVSAWLVATLVNNMMELPLALWRAEGKPWRFTFISLSRLFTQLVTNIILVVILRWGIWGVVMSNLLNAVVWSTVLGLTVRRRYGISLDTDWLLAVLRYGLPLVPASLSQFVLHYSDRFFLARNVSETDLGLYSLAYRFGMLVSIAMRVVATAWYPWVFGTAKSRSDLSEVRRATALVEVTLAVVASMVILLTEVVLRIMSAPRFWQASQYVSLIVAGCWFFAMHIPWSVGARLAGRTDVVARAHVLTAIVSLIGYGLMIPRYGAWGAAMMTLLSFVSLSLTCLVWSEKTMPIGLDVRTVLLSLLLMGAAASVDAILRIQGHVGVVGRFASVAVIAVVSLVYVNTRLSQGAIGNLWHRLWRRLYPKHSQANEASMT